MYLQNIKTVLLLLSTRPAWTNQRSSSLASECSSSILASPYSVHSPLIPPRSPPYAPLGCASSPRLSSPVQFATGKGARRRLLHPHPASDESSGSDSVGASYDDDAFRCLRIDCESVHLCRPYSSVQWQWERGGSGWSVRSNWVC